MFNLILLDNLFDKEDILGSKAVGQHPVMSANSICFTVKMARVDAGCTTLAVSAVVSSSSRLPWWTSLDSSCHSN